MLIVKADAPAARSGTDCENAALSLLDDATQVRWTGNYECWSSNLPSGPASDPWPGDGCTVVAPSRQANFASIIREVEISVADILGDYFLYRLRFANDAAERISVTVAGEKMSRLPDPVIPGSSFVANIPDAEMTSLTSTTVTIDCATTLATGWGIEVRRSDGNWNASDDRNLIGRFSTQVFTVPRLTRTQTYYLRLYDNSTQRKYSRHSTVIHVDYPY
jgi:hypothetical protein